MVAQLMNEYANQLSIQQSPLLWLAFVFRLRNHKSLHSSLEEVALELLSGREKVAKESKQKPSLSLSWSVRE